MAHYRITVLKRMANPDLVAEHSDKNVVAPCPKFRDGQVFECTNFDKPDDFCSWAWADIHRDAMLVAQGGHMPGIKKDGVAIVCCTDGVRPVVFKAERLD